MSVSASKRAANRLNAQKSTGPRTDQGKARSSRNAVTHGIYCSEWLVENEDGEELEALKDNLLGRMRPRDAVELAVVEEYLSCAWRLRRVRRAESLAYDNELFAIQASLAKQHREHPELTPPGAEGLIPSTEWVTLSLLESKTAALEKLHRIGQRLFNTMLRCTRELRVLQREEIDEADGDDDVQNEATAADEANAQNEATAEPAGHNSCDGQPLAAPCEEPIDPQAQRLIAEMEAALDRSVQIRPMSKLLER